MKVLKILLGVAASVYCVLQIVQLVGILRSDSGVSLQTSVIAGLAIILISAVVAFSCFRSAFSK